MKFTITEEDWNGGSRLDVVNCAVARCLKRTLHGQIAHALIGRNMILIVAKDKEERRQQRFHTPTQCIDVIRRFDDGQKFNGEVEFELPVEELLKTEESEQQATEGDNLKITVTKEDWDNGTPLSHTNCAVARAATRCSGQRCSVGRSSLILERDIYMLPGHVQEAICWFDVGMPFTGELTFDTDDCVNFAGAAIAAAEKIEKYVAIRSQASEEELVLV